MSYRPSAENMAEAEAAVLGSLLLDPEGCAPKVLPVLRASDFSDPANAEVFATIVELADEQVYAGTFPDHNSVRFRLREKKKLEQLPGGDAYLTILAESVAALWSLPAHVDLVRRESCRRRLTRRAAWLQRELAAGADPYELAATIAGELGPDALAAPRKGAATIKPAPISELMG